MIKAENNWPEQLVDLSLTLCRLFVTLQVSQIWPQLKWLAKMTPHDDLWINTHLEKMSCSSNALWAQNSNDQYLESPPPQRSL